MRVQFHRLGSPEKEGLHQRVLYVIEHVGIRYWTRWRVPHERPSTSKEAGLREQVHVLVGGAPVSASWAEEIGADGHGANAGMAVERARELVRSW